MTESRDADFAFFDSDFSGTLTNFDEIYLLEKDSTGALTAGWGLTFAGSLDETLPQPGDVYEFRTLKPISRRDIYEFQGIVVSVMASQGLPQRMELEQRLGELQTEMAEAHQEAENDIAVRDEAIGKLKEAVEMQKAAIEERDARDRSRAASPLVPADDALVIDDDHQRRRTQPVDLGGQGRELTRVGEVAGEEYDAADAPLQEPVKDVLRWLVAVEAYD